MSPLPLAALADDFSGAAEIAGIAHTAGLRTFISGSFGSHRPPEGTEAWVIDMDTRRKEPRECIFTLAQLDWQLLGKARRLYKKTDSALRGHILLETREILGLSPMEDARFIPANPARNRFIRDGRYSINGIPLHQTEFARDPNFPAHTDDVENLLRERCPGGWKLNPFWKIPDIESQQDLEAEAQDLAPRELPAGASPFFAACLQAWGMRAGTNQPSPPTWDSAILVSGSLSANAAETATLFRSKGLQVFETDPREPNVEPQPGPARPWMLKLMPETLPAPHSLPALLAGRLFHHTAKHGLPRHLLIEGGDTAAAILEKYAWQDFTVIHQWEPGITTIKPTSKIAPLITTKPGSYPWPEELLGALLQRSGGFAETPS